MKKRRTDKMKDKISWIYIMLAALFLILGGVEYYIKKDDLAATVAFVSAMIFISLSVVLLKLNEIIEIRVIEREILRSITKKRMEKGEERR